jgi:hypothetical protein
MRSFHLSRLFALLVPLALGSGCILFADPDAEDYQSTYYGNDSDYGGGGGGGGHNSSCSVGAPGCACTITGVCDEGLTCVDSINTCVLPDTCPIGAPGCACTAGGTCDPGLICKEEYCVSEDPCLPEKIGTESCQCTEGGACDPGLECLSGLCVDVSGYTSGGSTTGSDPNDTDDSTQDPGGSSGAAPTSSGG